MPITNDFHPEIKADGLWFPKEEGKQVLFELKAYGLLASKVALVQQESSNDRLICDQLRLQVSNYSRIRDLERQDMDNRMKKDRATFTLVSIVMAVAGIAGGLFIGLSVK